MMSVAVSMIGIPVIPIVATIYPQIGIGGRKRRIQSAREEQRAIEAVDDPHDVLIGDCNEELVIIARRGVDKRLAIEELVGVADVGL